jgi:CHAT domain-containing protein
MLHFHRHLHDAGHTAQALRQAALEVMQRPQFRHPFYWAGFLVMGYGF